MREIIILFATRMKSVPADKGPAPFSEGSHICYTRDTNFTMHSEQRWGLWFPRELMEQFFVSIMEHQRSIVNAAKAKRTIVKGSTHYEILGIKQNASAEEIKSAWKKMVMCTHPDRGGSAEDFIAVQRANEVLSDPRMRTRYDTGLRIGSQSIKQTKARQARVEFVTGSYDPFNFNVPPMPFFRCARTELDAIQFGHRGQRVVTQFNPESFEELPLITYYDGQQRRVVW